MRGYFIQIFSQEKEMNDNPIFYTTSGHPAPLAEVIEIMAISHPEPNDFTRDVCRRFVEDFGEDEFRRMVSVHALKSVPIHFCLSVYREFAAIDTSVAVMIQEIKMDIANALVDTGKDLVPIVEFTEKTDRIPVPKRYKRNRHHK